MAIEKLKRDKKETDMTDGVTVPSPDIEKKRKEFQKQVATGDHAKARKSRRRVANMRRLLVMGAAFLALLGTAGAASAYVLWYQTPEKIMLDAANNAITAKTTKYQGSATFLGATEPQLKFDGAFADGKSSVSVAFAMTFGGETSVVKASAAADPSSLYVKIDNATKLVQTAAPPQMKRVLEPYLPLIKNDVDGKWLRVSKNDVTTYEPVTTVSECDADVFQTLTTTPSVVADLMGIYLNNPFAKITDMGSEGLTGHYDLKVDGRQVDQFKNQLYSSKFFGSLGACTKAQNDIKTADLEKATVHLAIDKSTRTIQEIAIDTGQKELSKVVIKTAFNEPVNVELPKTAVTVTAVQQKAIGRQLLKILP